MKLRIYDIWSGQKDFKKKQSKKLFNLLYSLSLASERHEQPGADVLWAFVSNESRQPILLTVYNGVMLKDIKDLFFSYIN